MGCVCRLISDLLILLVNNVFQTTGIGRDGVVFDIAVLFGIVHMWNGNYPKLIEMIALFF